MPRVALTELGSIGTTQIITDSDTQIGPVVGELATALWVKYRSLCPAGPLITKDMSIAAPGSGDAVLYTKLDNLFTAEQVTNANWNSAATIQTNVVTYDSIILNRWFRTAFELNMFESAFVKQGMELKRQFLAMAAWPIIYQYETDIMLTYLNATKTWNSTGTSGLNTFVSPADYSYARRSFISDDVPPDQWNAIISAHDAQYLRNQTYTDKQPLESMAASDITGYIRNVYGFNTYESNFVQYVAATSSPYQNTHHNLFFRKDAITVAGRSLMPADAMDYNGVTFASLTDDQTGLNFLITHSCTGNPPKHTFVVYGMWGIKVTRTSSLLDVQSVEAL